MLAIFHNSGYKVNTKFDGAVYKETDDLTNVEIVDCDISGMRINGILLEDMLTAYLRNHS